MTRSPCRDCFHRNMPHCFETCQVLDKLQSLACARPDICDTPTDPHYLVADRLPFTCEHRAGEE